MGYNSAVGREPDEPPRVLFLEPFYGGSHRAFADGLVAHSSHRIELHTLPARFWKWRMRGAALHFARRIARPERYAVLLVSDLMSAADLKALWGERCPPIVLYLHENQLSYPLPPGGQVDLQFGFTDVTSALAASAMVFNSHFHRDSFFAALPRFLRQMPDYVPRWVPAALEAKAQVLYPGCRLPPPAAAAVGGRSEPAPPVGAVATAAPPPAAPAAAGGRSERAPPVVPAPAAVPPPGPPLPRPPALPEVAPLVIWNHRWEFDKQPEVFFAALRRVDAAGVAFRVALLGENFQAVPQAFIEAQRWLGARLVQYGYEPDRGAYWEWLRQGSVVVSTALQENFGIAVVEAVAAGNYPLLPHRLAYPEVIPERYHAACLYRDETELAAKLVALLAAPRVIAPAGLAAAMERFSWRLLAERYDALLAAVGRAARRSGDPAPGT